MRDQDVRGRTLGTIFPVPYIVQQGSEEHQIMVVSLFGVCRLFKLKYLDSIA